MTHHLIQHRSAETGFTIVELVIALAILAIILGLAVPSMQTYILNQRVRNASFDLTSDLLLARAEATKRNADVVIAANGGAWHNGWAISAGGVTLKQRAAVKDMAIVATNPTITYRHTGRLPAGSATQVFTLNVSDSSAGITPRQLSVNSSGKVSTE